MNIMQRLGALRRLDWSLLAATVLLAVFGLAALYSVTLNVEHPEVARLVKQAIFLGVGLGLLLLFALVDYRIWWNSAWALYLLGVLLLVGVLIFGETIRGTRGWFTIFGQSFQPVELVRIFFIFTLGRLFASWLNRPFSFRLVAISGALTAGYVSLLLLQPEFGYAILLIGVWLVYLLLARIPLRSLLLLALIIAVLMIIAWFGVLADYQKDRLLSFFHPGEDRLGQSYNVTQSIVAVGSGRLFGRGLGLGPQSQLNFLPEQSTDFIFAVIAEELGFVGVALVLGVFAFFYYRLQLAIRRTVDPFAGLVLAGFFLVIFLQMFVNIGMNLGLVPVTGIPLPFISYGGNALVANFIIVGIASSIIIRQPK